MERYYQNRFGMVYRDHQTGGIFCLTYFNGGLKKCFIRVQRGETLSPGEVYCGSLDTQSYNPRTGKYDGLKLNFAQKLSLSVNTIEKIERGEKTEHVKHTQSSKMKIDGYQVRVKHTLIERGVKPGSEEWKTSIENAVDLYCSLTGEKKHISKDYSIWMKRYEGRV